jgi:hypothetical protein
VSELICFPLVATGSISCRTSETPFDDIGGIGVCNSMSVCAGAINNSQAMRSGPVAFNYANFYAPLSRSGNWTVSSEVGLEAARSSLYSQHSMKLELTKHLDKVRDTVTEVDRTVSSHKYPSDRRTVMVMGLLSTIIQHHRSMLHLIKSAGTAGSRHGL